MAIKRTKILVVDDDAMTREMYAEVFRRADYEVLEASDGVEGLDIATKNVPDIIFTGIVMPRMDGFTMIETLKKTVMTAHVPFVISSHMGREEDQKRANQLGAKDFIVRDITTPREVVERITAALIKEGEEYKIEFNAYNLDAQELVRDLSLNSNYQCLECNEKLVLSLKLINAKERIFEARFVCPNCGWVAR